MSVSIKTRQAYSEIDEFLGLLTEEQRNEIPKKLRDFFKKEKDKEYVKKYRYKYSNKRPTFKRRSFGYYCIT